MCTCFDSIVRATVRYEALKYGDTWKVAVLRLYKGTFVKRLFRLELSPNYVISVEIEFEQLHFNAFKLCISKIMPYARTTKVYLGKTK